MRPTAGARPQEDAGYARRYRSVRGMSSTSLAPPRGVSRVREAIESPDRHVVTVEPSGAALGGLAEDTPTGGRLDVRRTNQPAIHY